MVHIAPPIRKALVVSNHTLDFGEALSLILLYSCGVIVAINSHHLLGVVFPKALRNIQNIIDKYCIM
jgi:hypothetical protein